MTVYLDANILFLLLSPRRSEQRQSDACFDWLDALLNAGHHIYVPDVAYHEAERGYMVRRHRNPHSNKLPQLKGLFKSGQLARLPLSQRAIDHASVLWAYLLIQGMKTSDKTFDGDVLIAAQIRQHRVQGAKIIATTNPKHLARMVAEDTWQNITP